MTADNHKPPKQHRLILTPSGRQSNVPDGITVLDAARQLGVELESICGGRLTCGKCLVAPETGHFARHGITSDAAHLSPPDETEMAYAARHGIDLSNLRLACAAHIHGDMLIDVPESSLSRKQVVRKAAGELKITVEPAVRLLYVEVEPAVSGSGSDWRRLQQALADQWQLTDLQFAPHLLASLQSILRAQNGAVMVTLWQDRQIIRLEPGYNENLYGFAVDIGSTTIAGHLCDLLTGQVMATATMMNPQVRYGEDLISRISYAREPQGTQRMHRAVIRALDILAAQAAQDAGIIPDEIMDVVLVGNTVMHHLTLGIDPQELGHLPFTLALDSALDLQAHNLGLQTLNAGARVHILPCIAGYVGADNVAVLLAEYPYLDRTDQKTTLIVDIGTNAEILLCTPERILSASSPTGPAFEGAHITHGQRAAAGAIERVRITPDGVRYKVIGDDRWSDEGSTSRPTGICGSGIIEIVAELFTNGLIEASGRFAADAAQRHPYIRRPERTAEFVLAFAADTATSHDIVVTQKDIRAVQLAKAALYAGVKLLMDAAGVQQVDYIRLAGAFGSYIDPYYAMQIGLIPDCDLAQVVSVGNAAGDGARIALINTTQRQYIQTLISRVEYIETAAHALFQDYYVSAMHLPHSDDPFPHLTTAQETSRD